MIQGIIFDLDGVLSDTQQLHAEADSRILESYGVSLTPDELTFRYAGVRAEEMFGDLFTRYAVTAEVEEAVRRKFDTIEVLTEKYLVAIPGAVALVERLHAAGYPMAIASSSRARYVRTVLERLGIFSYFRAAVCGDEVIRSKPNPEVFLKAAAKLDLPPEACLVFEDAVSGMQAAKAAGMACVGLVAHPDPAKYPADLLVRSLDDVTIDVIRNFSGHAPARTNHA